MGLRSLIPDFLMDAVEVDRIVKWIQETNVKFLAKGILEFLRPRYNGKHRSVILAEAVNKIRSFAAELDKVRREDTE